MVDRSVNALPHFVRGGRKKKKKNERYRSCDAQGQNDAVQIRSTLPNTFTSCEPRDRKDSRSRRVGIPIRAESARRLTVRAIFISRSKKFSVRRELDAGRWRGACIIHNAGSTFVQAYRSNHRTNSETIAVLRYACTWQRHSIVFTRRGLR